MFRKNSHGKLPIRLPDMDCLDQLIDIKCRTKIWVVLPPRRTVLDTDIKHC